VKRPSDYRHRNQYTGPASLKKRFWGKVDIGGENECWPWIAGRGGRDDRGYFRVDNNHIRVAHRVVWELMYGPIPNGMNVLHSCDNPLCCNPRHLFLGTQRDNVLDAVSKGRATSNAGEANPRAQRRVPEVRAIKDIFRAGFDRRRIAKAWGLRYGYVCDIVNERIWKGV
jgi:hypothetical protein